MIIGLVAVISSCQETKIYPVPGKDNGEGLPPVEEEGGLLVCSFNVRYYNTTDEYPWSVRKESAMEFFRDRKPDLAGLQELRSTQAQDFSYLLSDMYGYYDINRDTGNSISGSSGEGVGILYRKDRFVLEDKGFFWLSENPDKLPDENPDGTYSEWHSANRRVVVWVRLTDRAHEDQTVYFFATHFDHISKEARQKSSELTVAKIREIAVVQDIKGSSSPVFLVADFNCESNSAELAPVKAAMEYARTSAPETDDGRTFNGFSETGGSIIDHIFFGGPVSADMYDVVTDDYGVKYISDHYPILFGCSYR